MNQSQNKAFEYLLMLIVFVLLALFLIPWGKKEVSIEINTQGTEIEDQEDLYHIEHTERVSPENIAVLFGWRKRSIPENTNTTPPVNTTPEMTEANWLSYSGFINKNYGFIDNRTQRAIMLSLGKTIKGYTLIEIADDKFIIKYEGIKYYILKR